MFELTHSKTANRCPSFRTSCVLLFPNRFYFAKLMHLINKSMKPIYYFVAAGLSIALSIYMFVFGTSSNHESVGIFIGLWAPTIIGIGIYNELISIYEELRNQRREQEENDLRG